MRGIFLVMAATLALIAAPAEAGGEGGGDVSLSIGGESSGQFGVAYDRAFKAVQAAGLGVEKETQLLNMLEQGRKVYVKFRIENNKRQAQAYEAQAMQILDQVTAIVAEGG